MHTYGPQMSGGVLALDHITHSFLLMLAFGKLYNQAKQQCNTN